MNQIESRRKADIKYSPIPDEWNAVTRTVIGCAIEVHRHLGPGLLERIYEEALCYELVRAGVNFERQKLIRLRYKEIELPEQRMDIVVGDLLVVELKSIDRFPDIYLAQLVSYLRSADVPLGLLLNFNVPVLREGIYRRVNPQASAFRDLSTSPPLGFSGSSGPSEFDF